jgi:hypothetical protein
MGSRISVRLKLQNTKNRLKSESPEFKIGRLINCSSFSGGPNDMKQRDVAAVILGAGFSYVAGLPLTRDLFDDSNSPKAFSKSAAKRNELVCEAWRRWKEKTGETDAEIWLREIYTNSIDSSDIDFDDIIAYLSGKLVILPSGKMRTIPYFHGITRSVQSETHREFWITLRRIFNLRYVVTMNYDILAEQGLRDKYVKHHGRSAPICHYGGFPVPQYVRMMTNMKGSKREWKEVRLGDDIIIYKMHGSINWCDEPHDFKIHDDVRGVFRVKKEKGRIAIVPPVPEKERPDWLAKVWEYAEKGLASASTWIVCGYSMPQYDEALERFFIRAASIHQNLTIYIMDPYSKDLVKRWESISQQNTEIIPLPGLPEGIDKISQLFGY